MDRRAALATTVLTLSALFQPSQARADPAGAIASTSSNLPETVYFGNGCFWGRQKDFVDVELALGRGTRDVSAVVGYAGGARTGPDGKVCYYFSDPKSVYERLGHAEVVQVALDPARGSPEGQFKAFAERYFQQFVRTPYGMMRQDPQDEGPGYRNVIGLPGGVSSPLFRILQDANVNKMELRAGTGNGVDQTGRPVEGDVFNVVWVVDSTARPFYRAERYHQFHNGIGAKFPKDYTQDLKSQMAAAGRIDPTGCFERPF